MQDKTHSQRVESAVALGEQGAGREGALAPLRRAQERGAPRALSSRSAPQPSRGTLGCRIRQGDPAQQRSQWARRGARAPSGSGGALLRPPRPRRPRGADRRAGKAWAGVSAAQQETPCSGCWGAQSGQAPAAAGPRAAAALGTSCAGGPADGLGWARKAATAGDGSPSRSWNLSLHRQKPPLPDAAPWGPHPVQLSSHHRQDPGEKTGMGVGGPPGSLRSALELPPTQLGDGDGAG